jgi:nicotinate-nucleotide adenylyltransferase
MRIGILGGTFNPVHNAHVQMARIARDEAALDRVLLVVAADPPTSAWRDVPERAL